MKKLNGYICHGIFKGFSEHTSRPNAQGITRTKLQCAVEVIEKTQFGEVTEMRVFNVPDSIVQMGAPARMSNFINKEVALPFAMRDWEMNGRKGTTINVCASVKDLLDAHLFCTNKVSEVKTA